MIRTRNQKSSSASVSIAVEFAEDVESRDKADEAEAHDEHDGRTDLQARGVVGIEPEHVATRTGPPGYTAWATGVTSTESTATHSGSGGGGTAGSHDTRAGGGGWRWLWLRRGASRHCWRAKKTEKARGIWETCREMKGRRGVDCNYWEINRLYLCDSSCCGRTSVYRGWDRVSIVVFNRVRQTK